MESPNYANFISNKEFGCLLTKSGSADLLMRQNKYGKAFMTYQPRHVIQ
uniref:Uncharacterized protein n=1 Tax=Brugia malayi TaxID=6279 RepID=A8QDG1_BRUMA